MIGDDVGGIAVHIAASRRWPAPTRYWCRVP
jgi:hypothetical protein